MQANKKKLAEKVTAEYHGINKYATKFPKLGVALS